MSSAKTIADILAFAELIDVKSFIGNPFTSQPMYIAACAFLKEAEAQSSAPPSRATSPVSPLMKTQRSHTFPEPSKLSNIDPKLSSKHTLLATAANQNYQRCYKALKSLESYWAGTRYIVTVLDQKAKGIMDPLLYTSEDVDGAVELPKPEPAFTSPGWRRSIPVVGAPLGAGFQKFRPMGSEGNDWSSKIDPSQGAFYIVAVYDSYGKANRMSSNWMVFNWYDEFTQSQPQFLVSEHEWRRLGGGHVSS